MDEGTTCSLSKESLSKEMGFFLVFSQKQKDVHHTWLDTLFGQVNSTKVHNSSHTVWTRIYSRINASNCSIVYYKYTV